jgi:hypothetical protein
MSFKALTWVRFAACPTPSSKLVLFLLADAHTGLQNRTNLNRKLLLTLKTSAKAGTGCLTLVLRKASTVRIPAMRAHGVIRPHDGPQPVKGDLLVAKVRLRQHAHDKFS